MGKITGFEQTLKNGTKTCIRHGEPTDADALLNHLESILANGTGMVAEPGEITYTREAEEKWIRDFRDNPDEILLVAEVAGRIIGNLDFHIGRMKRLAHRGWFGMAIAPDWWGLGLGNALLETLIAWAETRDRVEKITLAVLADNTPAMSLYRKFGFKEEGHRIREFKIGPGQYADDILMYRFV